ncbi:MAG TPA: PhoPQ-activated protein PqaA family protein [Candidatus Anammoximicrobium sp.]|nr:PhoPQ-activated protein PqaA family protein [Candidatus Anammoximicrobium sp.]
MKRCLYLLAASISYLAPSSALPAESAASPLADYVAKPDASYRWVQKQTGRILAAEYAELILTSQTWRDIVWKHQLFVIKPYSAPKDARHALLFISGGSWRDELEDPASSSPPRDAQLYVTLAELLKTPVAVLLHVPHQPIFDGKREDAAIAYTFDEYLRTKDPEWPLLLPMVKSAVRGMDATQEAARRQWSLDLRTFTVTGASKRGWTTWLTSAVDKRVTALAPMVIDVLNMGPQLAHQEKAYGQPSEQIHDYTERGMHRKLQSDEGKSLVAIVDPYQYRQVLRQPKLIILGTNDPYWTVDALNLYWDGLVGEKHILYVPNNAHGLKDYGRVFGSLNALHQHVVGGQRLPQLRWQYDEQDRGVRLTVKSEPPARQVVAWMATAPTQDFRQAQWQSHAMNQDGPQHTFQVERRTDGFAAVFAEAEYGSKDSPSPYFFSTNLRVVEPVTGDR